MTPIDENQIQPAGTFCIVGGSEYPARVAPDVVAIFRNADGEFPRIRGGRTDFPRRGAQSVNVRHKAVPKIYERHSYALWRGLPWRLWSIDRQAHTVHLMIGETRLTPPQATAIDPRIVVDEDIAYVDDVPIAEVTAFASTEMDIVPVAGRGGTTDPKTRRVAYAWPDLDNPELVLVGLGLLY